MTKKEIKDWRGTRIEVGDVILYAVKHSTSVEVNEAIVRRVGYGPEKDWQGNDKPFVAAEWIVSSYCFTPGWTGEVYNTRTIKHVKLTNFEGITVVSKHQPPAFSTKQDVVHWSNT
jgi:hypothetical protein